MSARASVIVTGTEVLTGRITDRNGPWLAEQLRLAGVDISHIIVVGDRPHELRDALAFAASTGVDLVITSGGLGPTADDLTAEVVAEFQGRELHVDEQLQSRIAEIVDRLGRARGWRVSTEATAAATRKQALVPTGAHVLAPVGTAPGLVVPPAEGRTGPPVLVLPGPPRELQGMWRAALGDPIVTSALAQRDELRQRTIRLWGTPESDLAATLRTIDPDERLEITTCLRDGELEIVTRYAPAAQTGYDHLEHMLRTAYADTGFSFDGRTIDEIVAAALVDHGLTLATAESCTGGLLAGRLTDRPGSSKYVLGGVIAYANEIKQHVLGVAPRLIVEHGAVSAEVARAMALGVRDHLHADVGVGITGVAGPDGGTADKPVGLVHLHVAGPAGHVAREAHLPGDRQEIRHRSVVRAMHMIRELLDGTGPE